MKKNVNCVEFMELCVRYCLRDYHIKKMNRETELMKEHIYDESPEPFRKHGLKGLYHMEKFYEHMDRISEITGIPYNMKTTA